MAVSEENQQVYLVLPKEIVEKIDKEAREEMRSRSKQMAKIILDYYNK